ncbi:hypothetical protein DDB_G0279161 [Dictyostelium discoideum AX4]|uniref:Uncharacterized protein n=1 Tax=Dictyostelium discoideum TaxID=44689 RepID=Q54X72_DICDI|nr:hypothetical protein DDB_G0279161 [Dictyostelium discoideum AX4]EAL67862.1 hypothetical protein DDB_G0279161 [Dictyostelium discoideum AX4]|eukprot:XP_641838.1 hypothetical protein DDB_G0279161 [Dictyostelium discoideum AX4]
MNNNKIKISIISFLIILNFLYFPFENNNNINIHYYNYFYKNQNNNNNNNFYNNNYNNNLEKPLKIFLIPDSFNSLSINFSCISIDSNKLKIKNEETIIIFVEYLKQLSELKKSNQLIIPINEKSNNIILNTKQRKQQYDWLISQIFENKQIFNIKYIIYIQTLDEIIKNKNSLKIDII